MIRAVLLDVGGVLLLPAPELVRPALVGVSPSVATLDRAHYRALNLAYRADGLHWDDYFGSYAASSGVPRELVPEAAAGLRAVFADQVWTRVVPGAAELLRALRSAGLQVALVSNADGRLVRNLRDLALCQVGQGRGVEVEVILDSAVVGLEKPDPRFFARALAELRVEPHEAVHVGDTVHADVVGAIAAGVTPLHFVPYGDCASGVPAHRHLHRLAAVLAMIAG
jgi:putative hydrolase of the HAD superfamily